MSKFDEIKEEMKACYLHDKRPWMCAFSGGKDSTLMLSLVIEVLKEIPYRKRHKPVLVVTSDTGVENPVVRDYMHRMSRLINENCEHLWVSSYMVSPAPEESYWASTCGKGYQTPEMPYIRWCTGYLKIHPMDRFVRSVLKKYGEAVQVYGTRKEESVMRRRRLSALDDLGSLFTRNSHLPGAYDYNPLRDVTEDEVWACLLKGDASLPWGASALELKALYNGEDLPEEESGLGRADDGSLRVGGSTRFGCWVCTVACKDTAMQNFISAGHSELLPLKEFREWLLSIRNDPQYKMHNRNRRGFAPKKEDMPKGFGTYTLEAREMILRRALELENDTGFEIVSLDELKAIDKFWEADGDLTRRRLCELYYSVKGKRLPWDEYRVPMFSDDEIMEIRELCEEEGFDFELFSLLAAAVGNAKFGVRGGTGEKGFEKALCSEWTTHDEVEAMIARIEEEGIR